MNRLLCTALFTLATVATAQPTQAAPVGQPLPGLTAAERAMFDDGRQLYAHDFTVEEGLGPLYNERACSTCHGAPDVGGFDPSGTDFNVTHFTVTSSSGAVFQAFELGGPVQQRNTIAADPGARCHLPADTVPTVHGAGTSSRHTPAVFGFGLLDAIPDAEILRYAGKQPWKKPGVVGVAHWGSELEGLSRLLAFHLDNTRTQPRGAMRVGRFGWKAQTPTLFNFTTEPFNIELGVSTPFFPRENHPFGDRLPPECQTSTQPNDSGSQKSLRLFYFQALLAAPDRGPITDEVRRGEAIFTQLGCADCHRKSFRTAKDYYLPLPDGTPHRVAALSDQVVEPYSDLLIHDLGPSLADVRPMGMASGRFWRTTPLWGIRHKDRFLHDGSATTKHDAIVRHGGEAAGATTAYLRLSDGDRALLQTFLDSL